MSGQLAGCLLDELHRFVLAASAVAGPGRSVLGFGGLYGSALWSLCVLAGHYSVEPVASLNMIWPQNWNQREVAAKAR